MKLLREFTITLKTSKLDEIIKDANKIYLLNLYLEKQLKLAN